MPADHDVRDDVRDDARDDVHDANDANDVVEGTPAEPEPEWLRLERERRDASLGAPTLKRVFRDQRKAMYVSIVMIVAGFWILGLLGEWVAAGCFAFGVLLGYGNQLATELWLMRVVRSGHEPGKGEMTKAALVRLLGLTVLAVATLIVFWPGGIATLMGIALTRLILVVMTMAPLLKELRRP